MAHTIFIEGHDAQQVKELQQILQDRVPDTIVISSAETALTLRESDTVIVAAEEKATGILYRRLLGKLEDQVQRANFLGELLRLFSSSLRPEEVVQRIAVKSTEVLGGTGFIVLCNDNEQLRLDAAHSKNPEWLERILMTAINLGPDGLPLDLLRAVIDAKEARMVDDLATLPVPIELRCLVDKYNLTSLIAAPIRTKDYVLGVFITVANAPRFFDEDDLKLAVELSDFSAIALENASLFCELQKSAITDALTGLYNARFFNEVLIREAARADRYTAPLSLMMIDVDSFKLVNDNFGHVVGNKVLVEIAKGLQSAVRNTDLVFRCGGDEFGVVLPQTGIDGAFHAAEKVLQRIEAGDILTHLGYSGKVTVSIGVAEFRVGSHYETLVAEADQALYASKRSSKNCARTFGASSPL